jgi:hypothetical protein
MTTITITFGIFFIVVNRFPPTKFWFLVGKSAAECELVLVLPIGRRGEFFSEGQDKSEIREIDADLFWS